MQAANRSLSIRISTDGLSFCTYSPTNDQAPQYITYPVKPIISMAANLKAALQSVPVFREDFQRINVLISSPHFTTLPTSEFQREQAAEIYRFVFPHQENCHVSYNILKRSGMAILFGVNKNIHQMLLDEYPRARFYASASTLIEYLGEQSLGGKGKRMYVYLHEQHLANANGLLPREMSVYCFDQGRILFANTYPIRTTSDCLYYILAVWKQLNLDVLNDSLHIVDDGSTCQDLMQSIRPYIQHVVPVEYHEETKIMSGNTHRRTIPYDLHTLLCCGF